MQKLTPRVLSVLVAALFAIQSASADTPGKHPFYLHALSDLRAARAHLEHVSADPVDRAEERAIRSIDEAIAELKRAAIDDGKDIRDHKSVDTHLLRTDRFHKALELLDKAQQDASHEEDQPDTKGLRARVVRHIEAARREVHRVIERVLSHG